MSENASRDANPDLLGAIRVVLVETSHPGNIGATARAMKTMGLHRLALVSPLRFPSAEATARAAGADDVLYHATTHATLAEAVAGCGFVVGTTARRRTHEWPLLSPREFGPKAVAEAARAPVAIVFGREKSGLSNAELELCSAAVNIPVNAEYASLNLAAAVQVLAYEARLAVLDATPVEASEDAPPLTSEQVDALYAHGMQTLESVGFFDPAQPKQLPRRMRRMLARLRPDFAEYQILRGIFSAMEKRAGSCDRRD